MLAITRQKHRKEAFRSKDEVKINATGGFRKPQKWCVFLVQHRAQEDILEGNGQTRDGVNRPLALRICFSLVQHARLRGTSTHELYRRSL